LNNFDLEDVLASGNTWKGITTEKEVEMEESFMNPIGSRKSVGGVIWGFWSWCWWIVSRESRLFFTRRDWLYGVRMCCA